MLNFLLAKINMSMVFMWWSKYKYESSVLGDYTGFIKLYLLSHLYHLVRCGAGLNWFIFIGRKKRYKHFSLKILVLLARMLTVVEPKTYTCTYKSPLFNTRAAMQNYYVYNIDFSDSMTRELGDLTPCFCV